MNGVLRVIVIPRHIVVFEEREQPALILLDPLSQNGSGFCLTLERYDVLDEARCRPAARAARSPPWRPRVLSEVPRLQAICVNRFDDLSQQIAKSLRDRRQFLIERILTHLLIYVPH